MKAIKELNLPTLQVPGYSKAKAGETVVDPRDVYIWQQDVAAIKKQIVQLEEKKKRTYVLVIGQCLPDLDSKLQGSAALVHRGRSRRCAAPPSHPRVLLPLW